MNTSSQMMLFEQSRRLQDVGLLDRLAGAERVLANDPHLTREERMEILLLVVAPHIWGAEQ